MVEMNTGLVKMLIAEQFPGWAELEVVPVLPGGTDNHTFRLGPDLSVRLPSAAAYAPQVARELRWLPVLASELPLPVPTPVARGAPGAGYPWPWSVRGWLNGETAMTAHISDATSFAISLARFLVALQRIDATDGPTPGTANFHRGGDLAAYDAEARAALVALAGRIDLATAQAVWSRARSSAWGPRPVWVHGDVARGNLLVQEGRLSAVLDFGLIAVGDPACDLVAAWTLFSGASRRAFRQELALDDDTWRRARGWALWKAAITASRPAVERGTLDESLRVIADVVAEHAADA